MNGVDIDRGWLVGPRPARNNNDFIELPAQLFHDQPVVQAGRIEGAAEDRNVSRHGRNRANERAWFITQNPESTEKGFRLANFSAKSATMFARFIGSLALATALCPVDAQEAHDAQVPRQVDDETVLLPTQWFLRPVGRQIVVGDFPVNIALAPGGRFAAVLHSGNGRHEIVVLDTDRGALVSRVALEESFYGLAFSADGKRLHCSGAGDEV